MRRLVEKGLAKVIVRPKEHCGVFFVKKKDGRQRMVIDSRVSNRRFRDPPGVALSTTETFTRLEHRGAGLWIAESDVDSCFHRLRIDEELGRYFCLPPVMAGELGVCAAQGQAVGGLDLVWPCLAVAPMGWTWSLYFAQSINRDVVARSLSDGVGELDNSRHDRGEHKPRPRERRRGPQRGRPGLKGGASRQQEGRDVGRGGQRRARVLPSLRPPLLASPTLFAVVVAPSRRVRRSVGDCVGHMTFFAMLNRSVLSVLSALYKFVRSCYDEPQRLWPSCREELVAFLGVMPLVVAEWRTPWSDDVLAYDSCEEGRGHAHLRWEPGEARRVGAIGERSRYRRRNGGRAARESALRRLDPFRDLDSVMTAFPDLGELEDDWEEQLAFPEVPLDRVCDVDRTVSGQAQWKFPLATHR